jgi:hypothetical protein
MFHERAGLFQRPVVVVACVRIRAFVLLCDRRPESFVLTHFHWSARDPSQALRCELECSCAVGRSFGFRFQWLLPICLPFHFIAPVPRRGRGPSPSRARVRDRLAGRSCAPGARCLRARPLACEPGPWRSPATPTSSLRVDLPARVLALGSKSATPTIWMNSFCACLKRAIGSPCPASGFLFLRPLGGAVFCRHQEHGAIHFAENRSKAKDVERSPGSPRREVVPGVCRSSP